MMFALILVIFKFAMKAFDCYREKDKIKSQKKAEILKEAVNGLEKGDVSIINAAINKSKWV